MSVSDTHVKLNIRPDPFCASDNATHFQLSMGLDVGGEGNCWDGRRGQPGCTRLAPLLHGIAMPLNATLARWFYFRAANLDTTREITFEILNAGAASFPGGFDDYNVCSSSDGHDWIRVPATFENGKSLAWTLVPPQRALYFVSNSVEVFSCRGLLNLIRGFSVNGIKGCSIALCPYHPHHSHVNPQAYFAPYPLQRHAELIAEVQSRPGVDLTVLGQSLDGRDIDCLRIGRFSG